MLIALALGAAILGYLKLAAWWVIIPPTILLICYLALLREASRADAERRWAAASRTQDTRPAAPPAPPVKAPATAPVTAAAPSAQPPAPVRTPPATTVRVATLAPAPPPVPDAEIIDITARVSDDLYDQVADAKLRAVGD